MQRENRRFEVIPNWPPDIPGHSGKSVASPLSPVVFAAAIWAEPASDRAIVE
jgi:hypothetical protein